MSAKSFFDGLQHLSSISKLLGSNHSKERVETILEPLQGMVQLALLGFCPINTKLSIVKNNLNIQLPYIHQGVLRWYNNDNKQELVYIYNIIKRFQLFYKKDLCKNHKSLYEILIKHASRGLLQLQKTYESTENVTLVQTLKMYRSILHEKINYETLESNTMHPSNEVNSSIYDSDNEELSSNDSFHSVSPSSSPENAIILRDVESNNSSDNVHNMSNKHKRTRSRTRSRSRTDSSVNIEHIFASITKIYSEDLFIVLYHTFCLLEQKVIDYNNAQLIIHHLYSKYSGMIHQWILQHLVF